MRSVVLFPLAALFGLFSALPYLTQEARADGRASRADILPVKDIKKGMKGYGLTVFEGETPERFEVEVIDILKNFKPRQELILIKTKHPRLDVTKIVAGMSGSPIYLQGKMAGAYAYGWTFGVEPVAGVTPIRSMLDDLERPLPPTLHGLPLSLLSNKKQMKQAERPSRFQGTPEQYDVRAHALQQAEKSRPAEGGLAPLATPLLVGGLTDRAVEAARQFVEPLGLLPIQAGGGGESRSASSAGQYVDGGAIGVNLIRGDVSAMGLGTVTRVEGSKLVAFGHPMMSLGVTSLPTSRARVLWFMASQQRSFKMGEAVGPLGALVNDRTASIVVDTQTEAPTVAVSLRIEGEPGAPYQSWNFEVPHDEFLTPSFLAVGLGSGLEITAAERRDMTWTMNSQVHLEGRGPVSIQDYGAAQTGTPQTAEVMQSSLVKAVGAIFNNPWEYPKINRVDVQVALRFGREVALLRGVDVLTPVVDAGQEVRLRVHLEPYAGEKIQRVISVPIPKSLAGKTVRLAVRPGYAVQRPRPAPESLDELIANLENPTLDPRSLVVSFSTGQAGAAHRGTVAAGLPPAALDLITTQSSSVSASRFDAQEHRVTPLPIYVVGTDTVEVSVRATSR